MSDATTKLLSTTAPSGTNPTTQSGNPPLNEPHQSTLDATREALGENVSELNRFGKPKGKPGRPIKSGKWAKKSVPLGDVGNGTAPLFVESEIESAPNPPDFEPSAPPFDKAAAEKYSESIIDLFSELNAELVYFRVMRRTKDKMFAAFVSSEIEITDTARQLVKTGMVGLAEKHNVDMSKAPEVAFCGGLILWQLKVSRSITEAVNKWHASNPGQTTRIK